MLFALPPAAVAEVLIEISGLHAPTGTSIASITRELRTSLRVFSWHRVNTVALGA